MVSIVTASQFSLCNPISLIVHLKKQKEVLNSLVQRASLAMAELSVGLDTQQRFSTNFLDELNVANLSPASSGAVPPAEQEKPASPIGTNPFRSESPTPSDPGLVLDQDQPGFNFVAHLETRDSVSSLDQIGLPSPTSDQSASTEHQAGVTGVIADPIEQVDHSSADTPQSEGSKATPILVARTSEKWEKFDENGHHVAEPHPPTANGGHSASSEQEKESKVKGQSQIKHQYSPLVMTRMYHTADTR